MLLLWPVLTVSTNISQQSHVNKTCKREGDILCVKISDMYDKNWSCYGQITKPWRFLPKTSHKSEKCEFSIFGFKLAQNAWKLCILIQVDTSIMYQDQKDS